MPSPTDSDGALIDVLRQHVERLAGIIGPRHVGLPGALAASATLIERELISAGYAVERQAYRARGQEVSNLIAELPGSGRADEIVVLGAHYDTVPATPGADDNASAVAVLLEVARAMRPWRCQRTIRFVAFTCEEMPHFHSGEMGSQMYARMCRTRGDRVVGMLCLEMVGFYSSAANSQRIPSAIPNFLRPVFPPRGDFLAAVGNLRSWQLLWKFRRGFRRARRLPLFSIALPEAIHDIRRSDNSSFWDQGYPALMLTDTSYLRNPHYHLASDTPETLDYERMAAVALGVIEGVGEVARGRAPRP
ncbi:MAG TPA: M28 family peptidase [Pirellulales bacterium]|jgi:Zn-dependent M28 family amino/carboxypeptidase|nr:M28 family peptidase [Pirellulales bacterium]